LAGPQLSTPYAPPGGAPSGTAPRVQRPPIEPCHRAPDAQAVAQIPSVRVDDLPRARAHTVARKHPGHHSLGAAAPSAEETAPVDLDADEEPTAPIVAANNDPS
jgi:hypothetical protein